MLAPTTSRSSSVENYVTGSEDRSLIFWMLDVVVMVDLPTKGEHLYRYLIFLRRNSVDPSVSSSSAHAGYSTESPYWRLEHSQCDLGRI